MKSTRSLDHQVKAVAALTQTLSSVLMSSWKKTRNNFAAACAQSVEDLVSDVFVVSGHDCQHGNLISRTAAAAAKIAPVPNAILTSAEVANNRRCDSVAT